MKIGRNGSRFARNLRAGSIGGSACILMAAQPALSADGPPPAPATPAQSGGASAPRPPAGLTVHVDPKTGEFVATPAPGTPPLSLTPEEQNAFSTSHQGLAEVPVTTAPGGGYKLDLKGRFQSPQGVTTGGATGHEK